jgi:3-deoxy-D-manno-octulosonate 8-phosphate phosphatase (KDO 8-P phosphatase)
VHARAAKLEIVDVFAGVANKLHTLNDLCARKKIEPDEVAYIGDDLNDLAVMESVGLACAVADAVEPVKTIAHYVTQRRGGDGAVREVCELIIAARQ